MRTVVVVFVAVLAAFAFAQNPKIMLYGGQGHHTYLGCFNCSQYASDSIFNEYSPYGSSYSSTSIFNSFSQYGSAFSQYSACNEFASDPPVLVDENGNYYGRLTLNTMMQGAVTNSDVLAWLKGACSQ